MGRYPHFKPTEKLKFMKKSQYKIIRRKCSCGKYVFFEIDPIKLCPDYCDFNNEIIKKQNQKAIKIQLDNILEQLKNMDENLSRLLVNDHFKDYL